MIGRLNLTTLKSNILNIVITYIPALDKISNHLSIRTLWFQFSPTISLVNPGFNILKRRHHARNRLHSCTRPTTTNRSRKVFKISSCRVPIGIPDGIWISWWWREHVSTIFVVSSSRLHGCWDSCGRETSFCSSLNKILVLFGEKFSI